MDEVLGSCSGCPLLSLDDKGRPSRKDTACYAQIGWYGSHNVEKILAAYHENPAACTLEALIERSRDRIGRDIRAVRVSIIGDADRADRGPLFADLALAKAHGLALLCYTHMWRYASAQDLKGWFLASCETEADAREALAMGWKPALLAPSDHTGKRLHLSTDVELRVCPAQLSPKGTTCDSCRMCSLDHPVWDRGLFSGIVFRVHGVGRAAADRIARRGMTDAIT